MIVVTGGAGFIGSNIVANLDDDGADIVVCDRLRDNDKWRNLAKRVLQAVIPPEHLLAYLDEHRADIEAVVHMGAISATTVTDGDAVMRNNFELSRALWEWCTTQNKPFIYASSAATYGDGDCGFDDDWSSSTLRQLRPMNLYGWSKHLFDQYVARAVETERGAPPQFVGLKFFNVYGPNEAHKGSMKSVVAHLFPKARAGEPAELFRSHRPDYDDGGQRRDFVYVRDCADIVRWFLNSEHISGIFNVGTGNARSFADLATATIKACGHTPIINYIDMPEAIRDKYQYFTEANISRLRAAGYNRPMTSLEDGISDYVESYLLNDDPFR